VYNLIASEFSRQLPEQAFTLPLDVRKTIKSDLLRC